MQRFGISPLACRLTLLSVAVCCGCDDSAAPTDRLETVVVPLGSDFDPAEAGTLEGNVTWRGDIPEVPPYRAPVSSGNEHAGQPRRLWPNPHAPRIDAATKGVAGAVVFLRGVDPRRSRPWDHPPVRVELRDYQIHVCQGESDDSSGFVRRGETITMVSRQSLFHSLRARGADFFTRAFADADQSCSRCLDRAGLVKLSSGCSYFWMRGRLFVDDHPYYTHSDAQGRFTLPQVPPGRYELVCWLPNWHEAARELDAETALICRLTFRPPVERVQPVRIEPGRTLTARFELDASHFGP